MIDSLKAKQDEVINKADTKSGDKRRDKRVDREVGSWKSKLESAAGQGYDFDKITGSGGYMEPENVEQAMLNI